MSVEPAKASEVSSFPLQRTAGTRRPGFRIMHFLDNARLFPILLLAPVLIFFIIWNVIPTLWMVGMSFYNYSLITGQPERFIQLRNFQDIFTDISIWNGMGRTFAWVALSVGIETALGVILGFLFWGSARMPGRRLALTFLFAPMFIAPVAAGVFFRLIYDPTFGIASFLVKSVFGTDINFLGDRNVAFWFVLLVDVWMWTPFMLLITMAALGSVPKAELEAAEIDRMPWISRFRYIILPHGRFILMLGILLRTIDSFKTMDLIYLMTKGGPGNTTELIAITLWRKAFEGFQMGWSSALAVILLLVAIGFTSIYLYVLNQNARRQTGVV